MAKKSIKILFINMINPQRDLEIAYPPLGPAYLVSYIKKYLKYKNIKFKLISNKFEENIKLIKPDIVAITCVSQNYNQAKLIAKFSKKNLSSMVFIGGSHISLCPASLDPLMDIGVLGEGEQTFLELLSLYIKKSIFLHKDLLKIKGIIYWNKKKLVLTKKRELIMPLDKIPIPDRSLFKIDPNNTYMFSSRGCPYSCIFCAASRLWQCIRFHSAEYVFSEIKELIYKYGVKKINFHDDLFVANKQRIKELVSLLKKENLLGKVEFYVSARANLINDELCLLLKEMNVKSIYMGLESGSPKILKFFKGSSVTVNDNFNAVETIKKYGFTCIASFIIGAPMDTKETILDTLNFIKKSRLDDFTIYTLSPYPGTPIGDYAQKKGLLNFNSESFDWSSLDQEYLKAYKYKVHLAKNVSREELHSLFLKFVSERNKRVFFNRIRIFFTNPQRVINFIKKKLSKKNLYFNKWV
jgi:radical SAM superfamily enzyme YgiQ (UPF0313 family)